MVSVRLLYRPAILLLLVVSLSGWTSSPNLLGHAFARPGALVALRGAPNLRPGGIPGNAMDDESVRFAIIGDYGRVSQAAFDVANLVASWSPDFVITTGDNNYEDGSEATIDENVGRFYQRFIGPYQGRFGDGSAVNRFFPVLGNHDWQATGALPYLTYFTLPGNERYYSFAQGPISLFALDSDPNEPDGATSSSPQATWLREELAVSTTCWNVVYMHHPPYSSGRHGSDRRMQWPFAAWGADAVLAGHDHSYERILHDGIPYFVNGLGGDSIYPFRSAVAGSVVRYSGDYGAMLVEAGSETIIFRFITRTGKVIDEHQLSKPCAASQLEGPSPEFPADGSELEASLADPQPPAYSSWLNWLAHRSSLTGKCGRISRRAVTTRLRAGRGVWTRPE